MLFNSLHFLAFFPVVTVLVFALARRFQVPFLLAASCYFYAAFIPKFLIILFVLILIDYYAGIFIEKAAGSKRKWLLLASLASNLGILMVFKYFNFISDNATALARELHIPWLAPKLSLILPIGLSFHTFQSMAYTIEVYLGRQRAERSILVYALYVLFYPQLVAGPIERPQHLLPQLHKTVRFSFANLGTGLELMCWGFFKKLFVADRLAVFVNACFDGYQDKSLSGGSLLLATYFFAFQIYFDFSGYTDIARGAARVMGISLMENFDSPYLARSVPDFWRRWHISLSTWFRDYLYLPLGGNRVALPRQLFNVMAVFLLSGLWHGASWTFVIWGALHGLYVACARLRERLWRWPESAWVNGLRMAVTFNLVSLAWIFFRAKSFQAAWAMLTRIAEGVLASTMRPDVNRLLADEPMRTGALALLAYFVLRALRKRIQGAPKSLEAGARVLLLRPVYSVALVLLIVLGAPLNEMAFIYFQF